MLRPTVMDFALPLTLLTIGVTVGASGVTGVMRDLAAAVPARWPSSAAGRPPETGRWLRGCLADPRCREPAAAPSRVDRQPRVTPTPRRIAIISVPSMLAARNVATIGNIPFILRPLSAAPLHPGQVQICSDGGGEDKLIVRQPESRASNE